MWSPLSLFASSEQGAWYDPSDLSTMYEDSAGTTPAVVNQPVGRILDKSGNGNHATQATTSLKPVLRESGGLYYLQFDGIDDFLSTGSIDFTATDKMTVFEGVRKLSDATQNIVSISASPTTEAGTFSQEITGSNYSSYVRGSSAARKDVTGISAPDTSVLAVVYSLSAASATDAVLVRRNAVDNPAAAAGSAPGGGTFGNHAAYIGRRAGSSIPFNGHVYSLIVRGAASDAGQIANAETHVATKTGVTLP